MFRTPGLPTAAGRHVCIALGLVAGVLSASSLQAQQPAAPAAAAQAAPTTRVFSGDAGMVLNFIKPHFTPIKRGFEWINVPPATLFWAYKG